MSPYAVEQWLSDSSAVATDYFAFWNADHDDCENPVTAAILARDFRAVERQLDELGWVDDLKQCADFIRSDLGRALTGSGIDLAAGNCWAAKYLFEQGDIKKLYLLDYSKMLVNVGSAILEHYGALCEKTVLVRGSFYDVRLPDDSLDFLFLSAAFHHAEHPEKLLKEMRRVLKPDGLVIMIAEHIFSYPTAYLKHFAKFFAQFLPQGAQRKLLGKTFEAKRLIPSKDDLVPADPIMGDHLYGTGEYRAMFSSHGFRIAKNIKSKKSGFQSFILVLDKNS